MIAYLGRFDLHAQSAACDSALFIAPVLLPAQSEFITFKTYTAEEDEKILKLPKDI